MPDDSSAPPSTPNLPQGTLDMLILQVVVHGPIHGYAIAERLQYLSGEVLQVPQCSLLTALQELEDRKLVESGWTASEPLPHHGGGPRTP